VDQQVLDAVPAQAAAPAASVARTAGLAETTVREALARLGGAGLVESVPRGWRLTPRGGSW
jgi:DNA-binding IclR family transcriptional regulator